MQKTPAMRSALLVFFSLSLLSCSQPRAAASAPAGAQVRYLALGDSFTIGTGSSPKESFPARLSARLRTAGQNVTLRNLGVNGFTTEDLLSVELPQVRPFAPTLVTLAVGANDIVHGSEPETYRAQVRRILGMLQESGVRPADIVALPQPDWSLSPAAALFGEPAAIARLIEHFNTILRTETERAGGRYVDLFPLMRRQARAGMLAPDGLHPSAAAHAEWAAELQRQLFGGLRR